MASSARIDELRKKFDENPRRYFAPLANEYRKAGDLEQAIFICEEYLPQQPGHMSGHIVYGQALFELNRHEEAKIVFETALSLDPENLIALRHLGDIARQAGDAGSARIWYQRVLEADPRNEEIAQIMMSLLSADPAPAATPARSTPVDHNAPTPLSTAAVPPTPVTESPAPASASDTFDVEKAGDTTLSAPPEPPPLPVTPPPLPPTASVESGRSAHALNDDELFDASAFDLGGVPLSSLRKSKEVRVQTQEFDDAPTATTAPAESAADSASDDDIFEAGFDIPSVPSPAAPAAAHTPVSLDAEESDSRVSDETDSFEADPFAVAAAPQSSEPAEPSIELASDVVLGIPDDSPVATNVEADLDGLQTFEAGVIADKPAAEETISLETESFFDLPETPASDDTAVEEEKSEPVEVFVTETMATLYLQQGHIDSALDIYRKLIEQRPDDSALYERYLAVQTQANGTAPESREAEHDDTIDEPIGAPAQSYGGPTIREFLSGLARGTTAASATMEVAPAETTESSESFESADTVSAVDDGGIELEAQELAPAPRVSGPVTRPTPSASDTVGGSLGALFSGADAAANDATAANTLAEAFAPDGPETAPLQGMPAHRASDELSLDHVFKGGPAPRAANDGDGFSFDQFFSDDAGQAQKSATPETANPATQAPDDIAQFNAWLNGLKKS